MNKMKEILAIGITALLVCGAGIRMVEANIKDTDIATDGLEFTADELQDLYRKYNITENDIKFAMGELPHFLEGTILDGKHRVIATNTGRPPDGMKEGEDYILISIEEMIAIEEDARERYIEKYGVDPGNTKAVVNGIPLPKEEVESLVKSGETILLHFYI